MPTSMAWALLLRDASDGYSSGKLSSTPIFLLAQKTTYLGDFLSGLTNP